MKKIVIPIFFLFLSLTFFIESNLNAKNSEKKLSPWKKLKKAKILKNVKVSIDSEHSNTMVRSYFIEMKAIREILEKIELNETVILELHDKRYGSTPLTSIGKYTPEIETIDGEEVIKFNDIPEYATVQIGRNQPISMDMHEESIRSSNRNFLIPNNCWLVFKNEKKKIKARIRILFNYVSG